MKTLNLTNLEDSDIKYKISKFPDGQQQVDILDVDYIKNSKSFPGGIASITIKSRLNNFLDLELITCSVASLRNLKVKEIHLYVPYFSGSRSDRKFSEGSNNYLKDVICPIINNLNFESVRVLDPHSDVLEMGLKNFEKVSNLDLVVLAVQDIYNCGKGTPLDELVFISPDAGASKKIYKIAEQIGFKGDIITCSKDRDENGKLTKTNVPFTRLSNNNTGTDKDCILVDDICDGGATFINIAKELKTYVRGKLYLIVTHGIFSKGFDELGKYFDGIYCTNSYSDINSQTELDHYKLNVKQLNVF